MRKKITNSSIELFETPHVVSSNPLERMKLFLLYLLPVACGRNRYQFLLISDTDIDKINRIAPTLEPVDLLLRPVPLIPATGLIDQNIYWTSCNVMGLVKCLY